MPMQGCSIVNSIYSVVICNEFNDAMQCNAVGVNCVIRPSLNCFRGSITEERLKT